MIKVIETPGVSVMSDVGVNHRNMLISSVPGTWHRTVPGTWHRRESREAYDLIMRDKERLLSFDEPTCFIFSHSALREGWDNPNVFQICTLN